MAWTCQTIASALGTLLFETERDLAESNGQPFAFEPLKYIRFRAILNKFEQALSVNAFCGGGGVEAFLAASGQLL